MTDNNDDIFSYSNSGEDGAEDDSLDLNSFSTNAADLARKKRSRKVNGKRRALMITLTVLLIGVITASIAIGGFLLYAFTVVDGNMEGALDNLDLKYTTTIYYKDSNGEWAEYQRLHGEFNRIWVEYERNPAQAHDENYKGIPEDLVNAFVAIEDKRFREHDGVDWKRTASAFFNLVLRRSNSYGGSTITQQLVKNITSDDEKTVSRKLQEIMRARYLEGHYSKDTILESYLNTIYLGHSVYGVGVAANYYFGKDVSQLDIAECAALAAITKNPSKFTPENNSDEAKRRRLTTLNEMLEQGYINNEQYEAAKAELEELKVVASLDAVKEATVNNYYVDALIVQVTKDIAQKYNKSVNETIKEIYEGGYKIYSTVNPDVQAAVDKVYSNSEAYGQKNKEGAQLQGAITVMDYSGHVVGLAGGIGEKTVNLGISGFNRATDAIRQPGSSIKPLAVYAPAIEKGIIYYSKIMEDKDINYGTSRNPWIPHNFGNSKYGSRTIEFALEVSMNTIPVQILNTMSPQVSFDFITKNFGVKTLNTPDDINLAPLALGGTNGGLTTMQSAAAYAAFGNGGFYNEPTMYYFVRDQRDNEILRYNQSPKVAISSDTAFIMNKLLQNVVYGGNGTGRVVREAVSEQKMKLFGKTGTSSSSIDLWFSGGSPYYVASSWCGYDKQTEIDQNSTVCKKMWRDVMRIVHENLPAKDYPNSDYVVSRYYCTETGLLATDGCKTAGKTKIGWYKKNQPLPGVCTAHAGNLLDSPDAAESKDKEAANP